MDISRRRSRRRWEPPRSAWTSGSLVALTIALVDGAPAYADEPSAADTSLARQLGGEGVRLADEGHCDEAIDRLARSERLRHSIVVLERLAFCQASLGQVVEASETLLRVVREPLPPNATPGVLRAQERASTALPAVRARVARLRVTVVPHQATVAIDGEPLSAAALDSDRPINPGQHRIEATAPGYRATSVTISLADGEVRPLPIQLEASAGRPEARPAGAPTARREAAVSPSVVAPLVPGPSHLTERHVPTVAYVLLGTGAIASAVGIGFGVAAIQSHSRLSKACDTNKVCPEDQRGRLDQAQTFGWVSTFSLAGGLAALGVGAALAIFGRTESPRDAYVPTPWIGLGEFGVRGQF